MASEWTYSKYWIGTAEKESGPFLNKWWSEEYIEREATRVVVVSIFKKGNAKKQENYRPISLLNSLYKLYAAIIKIRIEREAESKMQEEQFGFRAKRSTTQPIHIMRRLQDRAAESGTELNIAFLDWEKAFDRIKQESIMQAMGIMGITRKLIRITGSIHDEPQFMVKEAGGESGWKTQKKGIRQGCPLSPCLFSIVMSDIFADVREKKEVE